MWWQLLISVLLGTIVLWGLLVGALLVLARREGTAIDWRELLRLLPDVVRLLRRLASRDQPRRPRILAAVLLVYLALPLDLVPDVIPVIGYADDAVIVVLGLRAILRAAGPERLTDLWPGTEQGRRVLSQALRLDPAT